MNDLNAIKHSDVEQIFKNQQNYFLTGATKNIEHRISALKKLQSLLVQHEQEILAALHQDLKKCQFEAYATEYTGVLQEIQLFIKKVACWAKPKRESWNFLTFPATPYIYHEPYGSVLNIAPWNYPFLLSLMPTVGAIAAGNTCVIKPSEISENTSRLVKKIINDNFDAKFLHVVEGDAEVSQQLLNQPWNYIFFTGSPRVGKLIYEQAAKHLTPVTLELGGKSPCIVHKDASLELAAKRILWGKFTNVGQTCVAPDYLVIHESVYEEFYNLLKKTIQDFYGTNPKTSKDLGRIISANHWKRLVSLAKQQDPHLKSDLFDEADRYIAPLLFKDCQLDSPLMKEEIFGPLLPCLKYSSSQELYHILNANKSPLAFYVFTKDGSFADSLIENYAFGGGCINDVLMHLANHNLPFGGVGSSGIGHYHGKRSFSTFSHSKAVLKQSAWLELASFKFPPFNDKKFSFLKFFTK
jgi:aldehyde dehydrogenase (NAD+)